MSDFHPYGALYPPFGHAPRNEPAYIAPKNPLPQNAMSGDCGDAGQDGYSVLSRASRMTGQRPTINSEPIYEGPRMNEEQ